MSYALVLCRETQPALANELEEFKQHLKESVKQMPVLQVWQLQGKQRCVVGATHEQCSRSLLHALGFHVNACVP